jgi:SET domain-containing protein
VLAQGIDVSPVSPAMGLGLIATRRFEAGDVIWRESGAPRGRPRSWAQVSEIPEPHLTIYKHFMYQVGHDAFESLPEFDTVPFETWSAVQPTDPTLYMNHSCDPTSWYPDPDSFEFVARRAIEPGEWVTYDYAMTETVDDQAWLCTCGTARCRGRIRGHDWQLPEVRRAYWGHVARHVQDLMETLGRPV